MKLISIPQISDLSKMRNILWCIKWVYRVSHQILLVQNFRTWFPYFGYYFLQACPPRDRTSTYQNPIRNPNACQILRKCCSSMGVLLHCWFRDKQTCHRFPPRRKEIEIKKKGHIVSSEILQIFGFIWSKILPIMCKNKQCVVDLSLERENCPFCYTKVVFFS